MAEYRVLTLALLVIASISLASGQERRATSIDQQIVLAAEADGNDLSELQPDGETILVELDMLFTIETYLEISRELSPLRGSDKRKKRKAILPTTLRWTNNRVPYEITNDFSATDRQRIQEAIDHYHNYTCIRLEPATSSDTSKVRFQNGQGCSSYVGMIGGAQPLNLGSRCRYTDIIIHEMGHAIGFHHEQTRPDRDEFVTILEENIQDGLEYNFRKYTTRQVNTHEVPYDYKSVMHYSQYAFSKKWGELPTIIAKNSSYQNSMGNQDGLSFNDIWLANTIYECAASSNCQLVKCEAGGFQAQDCKCYCPTGSTTDPVRQCSSVGPPDPTTTIAPTCVDDNTGCPGWTASGFCESKPHQPYMLTFCKRSCGVCS